VSPAGKGPGPGSLKLNMLLISMNDLIKGILLVFDAGVGRNAGLFEDVVAGFEVSPEIVMLTGDGFLHALISHPEGKNMNTEEGLSGIECRLAEAVDFLDFFIGHGKAANGNIRTMHHDV
jgi:hypothetical protein